MLAALASCTKANGAFKIEVKTLPFKAFKAYLSDLRVFKRFIFIDCNRGRDRYVLDLNKKF